MNQFAIIVATKTGFLFEFAVLFLALVFYTYLTDHQFNRKNIQRLCVTICAALVFRLIGELIKNGVAEARPCWDPTMHSLISCPDSFSFPSGHALGSMMIATIVGLVTKKRILWVIGIAAAILIAWSRVAVGVHTAWDVLAGAVMGAVFGMAVWRIYWYGH